MVPFRLDSSMATAPLPADTPRKGSGLPVVRIGGNVQASKLQSRVDPVYPQQARSEGVEGNVTLDITIDEEGNVINAEPTDGNPILVRAAVDAVKQWKYAPTHLNNEPVKVRTTVTIPLELK